KTNPATNVSSSSCSPAAPITTRSTWPSWQPPPEAGLPARCYLAWAMPFLLLAGRGLLVLLGALCVWVALASSIRTVILPRAVPSKLTRTVFLALRAVYEVWIGRGASYERRDQVMAGYAPYSLILLLTVWLAFILAGFTALFWALGHPLFDAFQLSASSIVTLGFAAPRDVPTTVAVLVES